VIILNALSKDIEKAFKAGRPKHFTHGKLMLRATQEAKEIYFIDEGFVRVYTEDSRGHQLTHTVYTKGEIFPFIWIASTEKRDVYYEALTDCTIYTLPRLELQEELQKNAKLSYEMMLQVINQYRIYADRIENLEHKFASERLAYSLLFMASRFGEKRGDEIIIRAPLTHQALGSTINLSRESISRELDKLVQRGLIGTEGRLFVIKDFAGLASQFKKPISPDWWGLQEQQDQPGNL